LQPALSFCIFGTRIPPARRIIASSKADQRRSFLLTLSYFKDNQIKSCLSMKKEGSWASVTKGLSFRWASIASFKLLIKETSTNPVPWQYQHWWGHGRSSGSLDLLSPFKRSLIVIWMHRSVTNYSNSIISHQINDLSVSKFSCCRFVCWLIIAI
jgi:hypothetical protein